MARKAEQAARLGCQPSQASKGRGVGAEWVMLREGSRVAHASRPARHLSQFAG